MTAPKQLDALVGELREVAEQAYADDDAYVFGITPEEATAAADAITALRAEIARLTAERDRFEAALARSCLVGGTTYLIERAEKAEAERDAALAAERAATIEAAAKACELAAYGQRSDADRFRAGTDPHHFRLALAAVADEVAISVRALHTDATRAALDAIRREGFDAGAALAGRVKVKPLVDAAKALAQWNLRNVYGNPDLLDLLGAVDNAITSVPQPITVQDAARVPEVAALIEAAASLHKNTMATKARIAGGISGQTIEAMLRSTFHQSSLYDLDSLQDALRAIAEQEGR